MNTPLSLHTSRGFSQQPPTDDTLFERIAQAIEQQGYCILPDGLPVPVANALLHYQGALDDAWFQRAGIGRADTQTCNRFVRRDKIHWIDMAQSPGWHQWTDALKTYLNRRLFLGLFSFESHLAHYQPGDFYKKHVDAFRGEANRVLSLVTYLNRGWEPGQGGELVLYAPDNDQQVLCKVTPTFGTLAVFLSEEFPHEVLPALRDRYSVAGWFRVNGSIQGRLDPPA